MYIHVYDLFFHFFIVCLLVAPRPLSPQTRSELSTNKDGLVPRHCVCAYFDV